MQATTTANTDTRTRILEIGHKLIAKKGFTAVGLSELLKTAGVPKGSFYHYFISKEQFGEALIEQYFEQYFATLDALFMTEKSAKERLLDYFHYWLTSEECQPEAGCCLVVKLSAEVADLSEPMRVALHQGCQLVIVRLSQVIAEGYQDGSIAKPASNECRQAKANKQAQTLYYLWLGADLAHKLARDNTPMLLAMEQTRLILSIE